MILNYTSLSTFTLLMGIYLLQAEPSNRDKTQDQVNKNEILLNGQFETYFLSKSNEAYQFLTDDIPLSNGRVWDDPSFVVPIGFEFQLFESTVDSLYFLPGFGGMLTTKPNFMLEYDKSISVFDLDLIDRGFFNDTSLSPISYKVEGNVGSRIFKLQWKNAGFYGEYESFGTLNDSVNFQLWLYEGTNHIQVRIGPRRVSNPQANYQGETGAIVGLLKKNTNAKDEGFFAQGPSNNPSIVFERAALTGTPVNGVVYTFSYRALNVNQPGGLHMNMLQVYPNPGKQLLFINSQYLGLLPYQLVDLSGKVILQGSLQAGANQLDLAQLSAGVYHLYAANEVHKIVKE